MLRKLRGVLLQIPLALGARAREIFTNSCGKPSLCANQVDLRELGSKFLGWRAIYLGLGSYFCRIRADEWPNLLNDGGEIIIGDHLNPSHKR